MWRGNRLPVTYRKRCVGGAVRPHVLGDEICPRHRTYGSYDPWRVKNTLPYEFFNESLPRLFFQVRHHMNNLRIRLLTYPYPEGKLGSRRCSYFTVTDFAKFLGVSGVYPFSTAM